MRNCKNCKKLFQPTYEQLRRKEGFYCCRKCANNGQKGKHWSLSTEFKKGDKGHWKGGKTIERKGYILIYKPNHPFCIANRYIREHRYIMEQHLGRLLKPFERVHHINGIKTDNRIKNLVLFSNEAQHQSFEQRNKAINRIKNGFKKCTKCHKTLLLKNFFISNTFIGYRPECKICNKLFYHRNN